MNETRTALGKLTLHHARAFTGMLRAMDANPDRAAASRVATDSLALTEYALGLWGQLNELGGDGMFVQDFRGYAEEIFAACDAILVVFREASQALLAAFGSEPPSSPKDTLRYAAEARVGPYDPGDAWLRLQRAMGLVGEVVAQTRRLLEWATRPGKGPTPAQLAAAYASLGLTPKD
jgi:hypothetical protein